ncbi:MAG TPA: 16S rRNA (cytosine(967)-C(5))-methyltransferase RsmB [Candidatus Acidoferrales bacterium]|jgi:16S rRNA (cytosine967-C5)-methyltransferase|nr:16S rRNA (cytosine(967)-C(5))-methyltransferase RsmB [Candidatus Acidoferrales bacterium]
MPVSRSRQIAFEVLRRVEAEGAYASDVLHAELKASVQPTDAALATEITMGVLRWRRLLDFLLERALNNPVERLDLPVALALRMGLYQLRFHGKVPARAAVNESVDLVKMARKTSAASLVNAVLRKMTSDAKSPAEIHLPPNLPPAERLGILHSHPTWMVQRWLSQMGEARTIALLEANNRAPRLNCALHDVSRLDEIVRGLEAAGMRVEPGHLLKSAFSVSGGSPVRAEAFRAGQISIQDEASQAIPLLLGVHAGDRVLDLCAAPGGKTPALIRAAGREGLVVAADHHAHRLRAMQMQFKRLGLASAQLVELDAVQSLPFRGDFGRILVDAPCTGTGTLARHPEIRWRLRPDQLAESRKQQSRMLRRALAHLARGGRLVYSTCSIEPEENENVIAEVLKDTPEVERVGIGEATGTLEPYLARAADSSTLFTEDGYFRTSPPKHQTDGFFAALLEKV